MVKYTSQKQVKIVGKPLGRPPKQSNETASEKRKKRKKSAERNQVEGKFGQAKRGYKLNNIKARLAATSESWVNAILFVLNLKSIENLSKFYLCKQDELKIKSADPTYSVQKLKNKRTLQQVQHIASELFSRPYLCTAGARFSITS